MVREGSSILSILTRRDGSMCMNRKSRESSSYSRAQSAQPHSPAQPDSRAQRLDGYHGTILAYGQTGIPWAVNITGPPNVPYLIYFVHVKYKSSYILEMLLYRFMVYWTRISAHTRRHTECVERKTVSFFAKGPSSSNNCQ